MSRGRLSGILGLEVGKTVESILGRSSSTASRSAAEARATQAQTRTLPISSPFLGRGMMGHGVIELRRLRHAVDTDGFTGPTKSRFFNQAI
jgi:hypothetical protein